MTLGRNELVNRSLLQRVRWSAGDLLESKVPGLTYDLWYDDRNFVASEQVAQSGRSVSLTDSLTELLQRQAAARVALSHGDLVGILSMVTQGRGWVSK